MHVVQSCILKQRRALLVRTQQEIRHEHFKMRAVVDPQQSGIGDASLVNLLGQCTAADDIGVTPAAQQKGQAQCLVVA